MALSIPSPQSVYRGNYASLPAATLKPPVEGNRTIPVNIGWAASGLSPNYCVEFNARHQQTLAINQIAAIHVDNSKCSSSMHIAFLDTQFEILIGPNAVGFYPVVTNSLEFFAWIDLQPSPQDTTILQVLNFLPPPILFGTQLGGTGVGTVREVDTAAPITGGPITDQGTIGLSTPLAVNFGGTGGTTGNAALDNLSGSSGATTGSLVRSGTGIWSVTAAGSGTITGVTPGNGLQGGGTSGTVSLALSVPVTVANGGTGATAGNAALDSLSAQSGANAGVLQRSSGGNWSTLLPLPLALGSGGTGASGAAAALTNLGAAPIASPVFTGTPNLPSGTVAVTQPAGNSSTAPATTAFVQNGYLPLVGGQVNGTPGTLSVGSVPLPGNAASGQLLTTNALCLAGAGGGNIASNCYSDGTNWRAIATGTSAIWLESGSGVQLNLAPSVAAGAITAPAVKFSIDSAGDLNVYGNLGITYSAYASSHAHARQWTGTNITAIVDGATVGTFQFTSSDEARKENFAAPDCDPLAVVNQIALKSFDWKPVPLGEGGESYQPDHYACGYTAQDIASLIPEAVTGDDGDKAVDLRPLVGHLIGAIQKLTQRLEQLEAK